MANCINDTRIPVRSPYINLQRWPGSDSFRQPGVRMMPARVVDSRSCRQMYLRSYTFSRQESFQEKTKKRFGKVREKISNRISRKKSPSEGKSDYSLRRVPCTALLSMFKRLMQSCTPKVDVAEN